MALTRYETLADAAERTGISKVTLRRRIAAGHLKAYRSGPRIIRLRPEDVDQMLAAFPGLGHGPGRRGV